MDKFWGLGTVLYSMTVAQYLEEPLENTENGRAFCCTINVHIG